MQISRRNALAGATAAIAVAGVPMAVRAANPEEEHLLTLFRQLSDPKRAIIHNVMRGMAGLPLDPDLTRRGDYGEGEPDGGAA